MSLDKKLDRLAQAQSVTPKELVTFYPRVVNNTNIPFTRSETTLLQKGLKYNTHAKGKNWIQNLALEAETAISHLPTNEREVYRKLTADQIEKLNQNNPYHEKHPEEKKIRSIQKKLSKNNAMIARADKGNSIVILPTIQYEAKIQDFILNNNFRTTTTDPTNTFQSHIRQTINESRTLIPRSSK